MRICNSCQEAREDAEFKTTTARKCAFCYRNYFRRLRDTKSRRFQNLANVARVNSKRRGGRKKRRRQLNVTNFDSEQAEIEARKGCSITPREIETMYEAQNGRCAISGMLLTFASFQPELVSLDRIDNNLGYHASNCRLVCLALNGQQQFQRNQLLELPTVKLKALAAAAAEVARFRSNIGE